MEGIGGHHVAINNGRLIPVSELVVYVYVRNSAQAEAQEGAPLNPGGFQLQLDLARSVLQVGALGAKQNFINYMATHNVQDAALLSWFEIRLKPSLIDMCRFGIAFRRSEFDKGDLAMINLYSLLDTFPDLLSSSALDDVVLGLLTWTNGVEIRGDTVMNEYRGKIRNFEVKTIPDVLVRAINVEKAKATLLPKFTSAYIDTLFHDQASKPTMKAILTNDELRDKAKAGWLRVLAPRTPRDLALLKDTLQFTAGAFNTGVHGSSLPLFTSKPGPERSALSNDDKTMHGIAADLDGLEREDGTFREFLEVVRPVAALTLSAWEAMLFRGEFKLKGSDLELAEPPTASDPTRAEALWDIIVGAWRAWGPFTTIRNPINTDIRNGVLGAKERLTAYLDGDLVPAPWDDVDPPDAPVRDAPAPTASARGDDGDEADQATRALAGRKRKGSAQASRSNKRPKVTSSSSPAVMMPGSSSGGGAGSSSSSGGGAGSELRTESSSVADHDDDGRQWSSLGLDDSLDGITQLMGNNRGSDGGVINSSSTRSDSRSPGAAGPLDATGSTAPRQASAASKRGGKVATTRGGRVRS